MTEFWTVLAVIFAAGFEQFTDITAQVNLPDSGLGGRSYDVLADDIDADGIPELYAMDHSQGVSARKSAMYAGGTFTDISATAFPGSTTGGGQGALFADLDGDGDLELLTGSNDAVGSVQANTGGTFGAYAGWYKGLGQWRAREFSQGDVDGDGDLDLIISAHHQAMVLATNNAGTYTESPMSADTCGTVNPILFDADNDGDMDFVGQQMSGFGTPCGPPELLRLYINDGTGTFAFVGLGGGERGTINVVDLDIDGDLDIVQTGSRHGNHAFVNVAGTFTNNPALVAFSGGWTDWWSKAAVGDLDNDGRDDLVANREVYMSSASGFSEIALPGSHQTQQAAVVDYDSDGDLDIWSSRKNNDDGWMLLRNDSGGNSIRVRVDAGPLNRFGIGSKISILDGALIAYRQVINASVQHAELLQHFGLGASSSVLVQVVFPSGEVQQVAATSGQSITVTAGEEPPDPQCADSIDNDADSLIDLADPGCANASDNDETDIVIPPDPCDDSASTVTIREVIQMHISGACD